MLPSIYPSKCLNSPLPSVISRSMSWLYAHCREHEIRPSTMSIFVHNATFRSARSQRFSYICRDVTFL